MLYYVGRDGQQFGQFTEEQIRQGLEGGRFLTSDLVWRDGMPQWKPLIEVFGFAAAAALSAPMVSQVGSTMPMSGGYPHPAYAQHVGIGVLPTSGLAVASMVMGILALVSLVACPVVGIVGILGVICGHMALAEIQRSGNNVQGRGMAIAGLVMSYLAVTIGLVVFVLFALVFGIGIAGAASGAVSHP